MAGLLSRSKRAKLPVQPSVEEGDASEPAPPREPAPKRSSRGDRKNGSRTYSDGATTYGEKREAEQTPAEKAIEDIKRALEASAVLRNRPGLRAVLWIMGTQKPKNLDGTPMKNKAGEELSMTIAEMMVHIGALGMMGASTMNPEQQRWWRDMMTLWVGPALMKPEVLELGAPGAPPSGDPAPAGGVELSDAQAAEDFLRWNELSAAALKSKEVHDQRELTAIDVKEELVLENLKGKPKDGPPAPDAAEPEKDGDKS